MRAKRSYYIWFFLFLPLLVALQNPTVKEPLQGWALTVLKPALEAGKGTSQFFSNLKLSAERFIHTFKQQGELESKVAKLESQLVHYQELEKENDRLRKLVDFRNSLAGKTTAARIIGWDPSPWRKSFILDKGQNQGIRKDMPVVSFEGLVGRVLDAGPETSRVILLTDLDARVSSMTDQTRAAGITAGSGSARLKMVYLDLESGVQVGETVLTSGLGGLFPKGLRIGKIISVTRDNSGLHLNAEVEPFVQFSKLEEVICLNYSPLKS